jgi:hypothetical protein
MVTPRRLLALVAAVVAVLVATAAPASAEAPQQWRDLAKEIAQPWPGLQKSEGWFPDYVYGGKKAFCLSTKCRAGLGNARYGESLLGYGLVMTGLREGDQTLVDTGLKSISYIVAQKDLQAKLPTSFEGMSVASTYNLMNEKQPDNPIFVQNKASWEAFMKRQPLITTIYRKPDTTRYGNHFLVEALEILELLDTGLKSDDPDAILGGKRQTARDVTSFLLNKRVPGIAKRATIGVRGQPTWVHSDPPDNPLSYFGFAAAMYARAIKVEGNDATSATRAPIVEAANAAVWVGGPDGDFGYYGRSQEDSWGLSTVAAGVEAAANTPGSSTAQDARYRAVTDRALARLRDVYGNGPQGLWVLPALKEDLARAVKGVDGYTGAVAFAGLTLVPLNWALDEMEAGRSRSASTVGADADSSVVVSQGESTLGVVRTGDIWFAVKRQASSKRRKDMRYDFGLLALKAKDGDRWTDVLRLRPTTSTAEDSVGPILRTGGAEGLPRGERESVRTGSASITGGYRTTGRKYLRRGVRWTWTATSCGVRLSFGVKAGDRYEYSTFFRGTPALKGKVLADDAQKVTFSTAPLRISRTGGYISGLDPSLTRAKAILQVRAAGTFTIETCRA